MRRRFALQAAVTALATTAAAAGLAASSFGTPPALAATTAAHPADSTPLPAHVYAPYFETYDTSTGLFNLSQESKARYLSLAFLQTAQAGSCTAYWNGNTATPIAKSSFGSDIRAIQSDGGNVIPSFGGFAADTTGTEIADSCTSVSKIAAVYEKVITTYNVPRIDMDVEGDSLTNTAGINRRNEAIAQVEAWAQAHHRSIQFSYSLPTTTTGLDAQELPLLQNAIADGASVTLVNLLTFDYFIGTKQPILTDTKNAANGLFSQLQTLYPSLTPAQIWDMIGVTEMPGIDDFGPKETFTRPMAAQVVSWAQSMGLNTVSMWALQRDNGSCPGTKGAGACSGIKQSTWYFSHHFEKFTS